MTVSGWVQLIVYALILLALTKPMGIYLQRVLDPKQAGRGSFLEPALGWLERLLYKIGGVDPKREHSWKHYGVAMLLFSLVGMVFTYVILRLQQHLPLNPQNYAGIQDSLALNTAASFTTNTNWQFYAGEAVMSYFSQMVALVIHNFFSAAVGIAIAAAVVRGIARRQSKTLGNFWADLVRLHLYLLLPICVLFALFLVSQGNHPEFCTVFIRQCGGFLRTVHPSTDRAGTCGFANRN